MGSGFATPHVGPVAGLGPLRVHWGGPAAQADLPPPPAPLRGLLRRRGLWLEARVEGRQAGEQGQQERRCCRRAGDQAQPNGRRETFPCGQRIAALNLCDCAARWRAHQAPAHREGIAVGVVGVAAVERDRRARRGAGNRRDHRVRREVLVGGEHLHAIDAGARAVGGGQLQHEGPGDVGHEGRRGGVSVAQIGLGELAALRHREESPRVIERAAWRCLRAVPGQVNRLTRGDRDARPGVGENELGSRRGWRLGRLSADHDVVADHPGVLAVAEAKLDLPGACDVRHERGTGRDVERRGACGREVTHPDGRKDASHRQALQRQWRLGVREPEGHRHREHLSEDRQTEAEGRPRRGRTGAVGKLVGQRERDPGREGGEQQPHRERAHRSDAHPRLGSWREESEHQPQPHGGPQRPQGQQQPCAQLERPEGRGEVGGLLQPGAGRQLGGGPVDRDDTEQRVQAEHGGGGQGVRRRAGGRDVDQPVPRAPQRECCREHEQRRQTEGDP